MKIVVLNGSPKGDSSVTIHSVKYLQKKYKLITERLKKDYYDLELLDVNYWKNIISTL